MSAARASSSPIPTEAIGGSVNPTPGTPRLFGWWWLPSRRLAATTLPSWLDTGVSGGPFPITRRINVPVGNALQKVVQYEPVVFDGDHVRSRRSVFVLAHVAAALRRYRPTPTRASPTSSTGRTT